jgi:malonyl-CoA O-methyltransferase
MTTVIDTEVIAQNFSNAAHTYDAWAHPQTLVAKKLCTLLPDEATFILDVGCGTGIMADLMRKRYPNAHITGIDPAKGMVEQCKSRFASDEKTSFFVNSAEKYEAASCFDLVASTFSMHWFSDKAKALQNIKHSLNHGGSVAVTIPILGSLPELYESYLAATDHEMPGLKLLSAEYYCALFSKAGLPFEQVMVDELRMNVSNPMAVINSLRCIGGAPRGLSDVSPLPQRQMQKLLDFYSEYFSSDEGVDFTYMILFGTTSRVV